MRLDVTIALLAFVPTILLSGRYSWRVSTAFGVALSVAAPLELLGIGPTIRADNPIRFALPFALGALSFWELYRQRARWGAVSRAYLMALVTFALAGVDVAAPFLYALGGAWIVPGFTIATCVMIWAIYAAPKGKIPWLAS